MRFFRLFALAACLMAGALGNEGIAAETLVPEAVTAEALFAQAAESSPKVLTARAALEKARIAYQATLPIKGASLSASAKAGYGAAATSGPNADSGGTSLSGSASLSLPILPNLSVGAGIEVSNTVSGSGSVTWTPLSSNEKANSAKLAYELAQADLVQALRDASQDTSAKIIAFIEARESLASARESKAIASIALMGAKAKDSMGQVSASALLKAEKDAANADRAVARAENALEKARINLTAAVGGEAGKRIDAGADVAAEGLVSDDDWAAPGFEGLPKKKTVLQAEANLANEKRTSIFASGNGPLSLKASVDTNLSISLTGTLSLSLSQIDGSDAKSKKLAIEAAQRSLEEAQSAAALEYSDAVFAAGDALLALKDAEYQLEIDSQSARAAELKQEAGSISESDYRAAIKAEKEAAAKVASARMTLARARAWFVVE